MLNFPKLPKIGLTNPSTKSLEQFTFLEAARVIWDQVFAFRVENRELFAGVSIFDFEHVNARWVLNKSADI